MFSDLIFRLRALLRAKSMDAGLDQELDVLLRDGRVRLLAPGDWSARATGSWHSDATGATYPSGWEIAVPGEGLRLAVTPERAAAENRSELVPGLFYWEGPVRAVDERGAPAGEGYVELTGYGERARPPI